MPDSKAFAQRWATYTDIEMKHAPESYQRLTYIQSGLSGRLAEPFVSAETRALGDKCKKYRGTNRYNETMRLYAEARGLDTQAAMACPEQPGRPLGSRDFDPEADTHPAYPKADKPVNL